jgi:hypothetical protein
MGWATPVVGLAIILFVMMAPMRVAIVLPEREIALANSTMAVVVVYPLGTEA